MTLGYPRSDTVLGFKGQRSSCHRVSKFILYTRTLHTRTAIHRYSLSSVTSRLRFSGCLVRASLTFARWRNHSSAWVRSRDRVPSSFDCVCLLYTVQYAYKLRAYFKSNFGFYGQPVSFIQFCNAMFTFFCTGTLCSLCL